MNRQILFSLLVAAISCFGGSAEAVVINGQDFEKLVSANVNGKVGEWYAMRKGYSFGVYGDAARWTQVDVTSTTFESSEVASAENASKFSFEFMKQTTAASGALTATDIKLFNSVGDILLSLKLKSGSISATPRLGAAGDFTLTGLFEAVGGRWFTGGVVSGELYASINYATGVISNSNDFHATGGSFSLYGSRRSEEPVPEPATALLLGMGAAGGVMRKKRAVQA